MKQKKLEMPGCVMCLECKEVLVSNYTHDFAQCACKNGSFVDGGKAYLRYGGVKLDLVLPLKLSRYPKRKVK